MRRMYDKEEIKEIAAESGGSKIDSLDLVVGQPTVTYDTTDGITIESTGKLNGTDDIVVSNEIPIVAGKGIVIDKLADKEQVEIKVDINDAVKYNDYEDSVVIGNKAEVYYPGSIAIGDHTKSNKESISIGNYNNNVSATSNYSIIIGNYCTVKGHHSIALGYSLINIDHYAVTVFGEYNSPTVLGDKFILADGTSHSNEHNYFKITKDSSNVYHMFLDNTEVPTKTKTLFGNQSIVGTGNIDLYCHNISFSDKVYFTATSSNNLQIDSLTDLQTVFPDDIWKSASGTSPDQQKTVVALNPQQMKVRYTDSTESSLAEYEAPVDVVTTI